MAAQQSTPASTSKRFLAWLVALPGLLLRSVDSTFKQGGISQAGNLSFYTFLGLVPWAIVLVLTFQWFPANQDLGYQLLEEVYQKTGLDAYQVVTDANDPATLQPLTTQLTAQMNAAFSGFDRRLAMIVNLLLSLVAALGILVHAECAFNRLWHTSGHRDGILRLINYWVILTVGAAFLILHLYLFTRYQPLGWLCSTRVAPWLLLVSSVVIGLFVLYYVLPKADVRAGICLVSALVVTGLWAILAWGFNRYLYAYIPTYTVRGVMGLLPLIVFTVFLAWLVVLYGARLAYVLQHLSPSSGQASTSRRHARFMINDLTVTNILREVSNTYQQGHKPVAGEQVLGRLGIPQDIGNQVISYLIDAGYLIHAKEPTQGYVPVKSIRDIKVTEISAIVANASVGQRGALEMTVDQLEEESQLETNATDFTHTLPQEDLGELSYDNNDRPSL